MFCLRREGGEGVRWTVPVESGNEWTAPIGASGIRRASERRARPGAAPAHQEEEERRKHHSHQQRPGAPKTVREEDEHLAVASISLAAPHLRVGLGPAIYGERGPELIALLEHAVRPTTDESSAADLRVNAFALRCLPLCHSGAPSRVNCNGNARMSHHPQLHSG